MDNDFERIVSFESKPKVKLAGELKGSEIICKQFSCVPFLQLFLSKEAHARQLIQPLEVAESGNRYYIAYKDKLISSAQVPEVLRNIKDGMNPCALKAGEVVGEINNLQIVFNSGIPIHTVYVSRDKLRPFLPEKEFLLQTETPVFIGKTPRPLFVYRNRVVEIDGILYRYASPITIVPDEDALLVKHFVLKQEHAFDKMKTQVEAFERFEKALQSKREPLPEEVKMYVWRRDEGKCVLCSGQRNLEFDHIIPLSRGGSNTERNIQLLCETCNRQKSNNI